MIIAILAGVVVYLLSSNMKLSYKIGYYEQKLENRNVDIEHIKNISLIRIVMGRAE